MLPVVLGVQAPEDGPNQGGGERGVRSEGRRAAQRGTDQGKGLGVSFYDVAWRVAAKLVELKKTVVRIVY